MARTTTTKTTEQAAGFDPAATYSVTLAGVVDLGLMKLRPAHSYRLTGEALNGIPADKIASATLVPAP